MQEQIRNLNMVILKERARREGLEKRLQEYKLENEKLKQEIKELKNAK